MACEIIDLKIELSNDEDEINKLKKERKNLWERENERRWNNKDKNLKEYYRRKVDSGNYSRLHNSWMENEMENL